MDSLDDQQLFKSEFIIGTNILDNTQIECIETVIDWTYFKSNIVIKGDYKSENKKNYGYLGIENINLIKIILDDLVLIFKNRYPLSQIKDFKKIYFHDTLNIMENFIAKCKYYCLDEIPQLTIQIDISCNDFNFDNKIIDLIFEASQDINYYEQHYMEIVGLINNLTYGVTDSESNIIQPRQILKKKDKLTVPQIETKTDKLTVKQIALLHVYNGIQITRKNSDKIVAEYGYTSGEGLFQDYILYCSAANRKAKPDPFSIKKLDYKIKLFESIVKYLSKEAQARAVDEIKILRSHKSKEI